MDKLWALPSVALQEPAAPLTGKLDSFISLGDSVVQAFIKVANTSLTLLDLKL